MNVKLENIRKTFGSVVAVDRIDLEIRDGEFMVLLGPSGCGKTTTLRIIAGLEKPDRGRVLFGDRDVTYLPPKDRNVSMVFQSYAVWPHMKVYDNIAFPLKIRRYPREEIDRRVRWAAELLKISDLLDRYPHQLSGGQRQRVAVARAIVVEPQVLLMDEPLSNLDAPLRALMRAEIKRLQKQLKITTIYVTHDQAEALTMADRIAVMNSGRIEQIGTPDEVYLKPASLFVAKFIGIPQINVFNATIKVHNDSIILDAADFSIDLGRDLLQVLDRYIGKSVDVGIRPESIYIEAYSPKEARVSKPIRAIIDLIEPLGSETIVHLRIGGISLRVKVPHRVSYGVGDEVNILFDLDAIHIFDRSSGKAII